MANEGRFRISGQWGTAWRDGQLLADVVQVDSPVELSRIAVPIVGSQREGYKMGRETREGTLRVQKYDTAWELYVYSFLSQTVEQRRADRDRGVQQDPSFTVVIKYDDPEALGVERWQLNGCRIWRLPLGFSEDDELVYREYPLTWESEAPLSAFKRNPGSGSPTATYAVGGP